VRFKARLVEADERESGARMLLNFGHTFGHAVEAATNYKKYLHGEAVAMGMVAATRIAESKGLCTTLTRERLEALLKRFSLPVEIPAAVAPRLAAFVAGDKKARGGRLTLVFPRKIGEAEIVLGFDVRDIRKMLKETICQ
jgi:3-dehydroquinate synthase